MRFMSNLCFALGVVLLGVSAYLYIQDDGDARVTIDEPERQLSLKAGDKLELAFPIHNPRRQKARVVGLAEC